MSKIRKLYDEAAQLHAQATALLGDGELSAEKSAQVDQLLDRVEELTTQAKRLERAEETEKALQAPMDAPKMFEHGSFDGVQIKVGDRVLERDELDEMRQFLPFASYWVQAGKDYSHAMRSYMRKGERELPDVMRKTLLAGTAPAGGYLVQDNYYAGLVAKAKEISAMRRICGVMPPVPSGAVIVPTEESLFSDATWTTEVGTGNTDSQEPFGQRRLMPKPLAKRVKVSNTFLRLPTFDVEGYVRDRMAYKFAVPEEHAFINGTGANSPQGLLQTSGLPVYTTAAANTVTADDVINFVYRLPAAYAGAPSTRILANRAFIRKVRLMKTGDGAYIWQPGLQIGSPGTILDIPYETSDRFDDGLDANDAWESNAVVAAVGDFSYYWIVDALQMSIQRLVELYAESNQTGFIGRKEVDGMCVLPEAFYVLKVKA